MERIQEETQLTASAGVSYNKMLAKIASNLNKPNGIAVITPDKALDFIATLPIEKFHGIGKATATQMKKLGIYNGLDLRQCDLKLLIKYFGKKGLFYHHIAHGRDDRQVNPNRVHKSIGSEVTFAHDISTLPQIYQALLAQNNEAFSNLNKKHMQARTITIKLKYNNFQQLTRSRTLDSPFRHETDAHYWIKELLIAVNLTRPVRLVGVTYSSLSTTKDASYKQPSLF